MGIHRILAALIAAVAATLVAASTAHAAFDNELSSVDEQGRTLAIEQWDTLLKGVSPLDQNPLTREWFHTGRAVYHVTGEKAEEFIGMLELGYQVSYPWNLDGGLNFSYTSPNLNLDRSVVPGIFARDGALVVQSPPILPGVAVSANLGNGPGLKEVTTLSADVAGADGAVAVGNAHGTVSGAAGGVTLRPFARLTSKDGDSVTTYGEPWEMH